MNKQISYFILIYSRFFKTTLHKKTEYDFQSFLVNVSKSTSSCRVVHIYQVYHIYKALILITSLKLGLKSNTSLLSNLPYQIQKQPSRGVLTSLNIFFKIMMKNEEHHES